jgi:hypothetical protein
MRVKTTIHRAGNSSRRGSNQSRRNEASPDRSHHAPNLTPRAGALLSQPVVREPIWRARQFLSNRSACHRPVPIGRSRRAFPSRGIPPLSLPAAGCSPCASDVGWRGETMAAPIRHPPLRQRGMSRRGFPDPGERLSFAAFPNPDRRSKAAVIAWGPSCSKQMSHHCPIERRGQCRPTRPAKALAVPSHPDLTSGGSRQRRSPCRPSATSS